MKEFVLIIFLILSVLVSGCTKQQFSSEINDVYENIDFSQKCTTSQDCDNSFIEHSCLKCPNDKIVISQGCQSEPKVIIGPENGGICVQTHMLGSGYGEFKSGECIPNTAFCLMNIEDKEIPTTNTDTKEWVAIWKEFVLNSQKISENYFNHHISVESFDTSEWMQGTSFRINYDINVDWATVKSCDHFLIQRKNETEYLTRDEVYSIPDYEGGLKNRMFLSNGCENAKKLKEFGKIIDKNGVGPNLKKCHRSITWDSKKSVVLNNEGKLVVNGYGTINEDKNECKFASLDLETGELLECTDVPCFIT